MLKSDAQYLAAELARTFREAGIDNARLGVIATSDHDHPDMWYVEFRQPDPGRLLWQMVETFGDVAEGRAALATARVMARQIVS